MSFMKFRNLEILRQEFRWKWNVEFRNDKIKHFRIPAFGIPRQPPDMNSRNSSKEIGPKGAFGIMLDVFMFPRDKAMETYLVCVNHYFDFWSDGMTQLFITYLLRFKEYHFKISNPLNVPKGSPCAQFQRRWPHFIISKSGHMDTITKGGDIINSMNWGPDF